MRRSCLATRWVARAASSWLTVRSWLRPKDCRTSSRPCSGAPRANRSPISLAVASSGRWICRSHPPCWCHAPRPNWSSNAVLRCSAARAPQSADLGTGSGAIALALAWERRGWSVTATDRSEAALAVAEPNGRALGISQCAFCQRRLVSTARGSAIDLIASNPPYVAAADPALSDPALRHEPLGALASGATGLEASELR